MNSRRVRDGYDRHGREVGAVLYLIYGEGWAHKRPRGQDSPFGWGSLHSPKESMLPQLDAVRLSGCGKRRSRGAQGASSLTPRGHDPP